MAPGGCGAIRLPFDSVDRSKADVEGGYVLDGYIKLNVNEMNV